MNPRVSLVASIISVALVAMPVFAEGHAFPGVGEAKKWEEASGTFNQGISFYRAGNYSKAIEKYKQAISIYPHDYEFFNNLGLTYKKNSQYDLAVEALNKSIELKPNIWESWSNLGSVYKHQKKTKEAIDSYTKALEYNPPAKSKTLILQNVAMLKAEAKESTAAPGATPAPATNTESEAEHAKNSAAHAAPDTVSPGAQTK